MAGWRRSDWKAAAEPVVLGLGSSHEDWRTLPPPPTVLRTLVPTVAVDGFSGSLSTRRDPSFLSELSHHVDHRGPAGLITGIATVVTNPQPLTYQPDESVPLAGHAETVQRSGTSWQLPRPPLASLTTAPPVDPVPIWLPGISGDAVISADAADLKASTDAAVARSHEPGAPGLPPVPSGNPSVFGEIVPGPAASGQADDVTGQRQVPGERAAPQRRRLGLGPPLIDPLAGHPRVVSPRPVVARSEGTPPRHPTGTEPEVSAAKRPANAPLIGGPQRPPVARPSIDRPTSGVTGTGPATGEPAVQRSPTASQASADNVHPRSPSPAPGPMPSAEPRLVIAVLPDPGTDEPAGPMLQHGPAVQRQLSDLAARGILPRHAEVAPLVGHRPRAGILDVWPGTTTRSSSPREGAAPTVSQDNQVQRSVYAGPPISGGASAGSEAAHGQRPSWHVDPGEIAVSRGLARRDDDGSVVFRLSPSAGRPAPYVHPSAPSDESGVWRSFASSPDTVQRQAVESPADIAEQSPDTTSAATVPVAVASEARSPAPASPSAAASTPAAPGVPLDELARQLFGPLSARLKAELRLERERVGLLTDLRQ